MKKLTGLEIQQGGPMLDCGSYYTRELCIYLIFYKPNIHEFFIYSSKLRFHPSHFHMVSSNLYRYKLSCILQAKRYNGKVIHFGMGIARLYQG